MTKEQLEKVLNNIEKVLEEVEEYNCSGHDVAEQIYEVIEQGGKE